jgi:hypothetical protein
VWLAGCWRQVEAGQVVDEVWLAPAAGMMLGVSRSIEADTLRDWAMMQVRGGPNGLVLEVTASGMPTVAFLASAASDSSVTFENLTRQYPTAIRYSRRREDSLFAVVSGTVRDRPRTLNFAYARASCPGQ